MGLRGVEIVINLFKLDMFIVFDCLLFNDIYDKDFMFKLGNGFLLRIFDFKNIMLFLLKEYFKLLVNIY